MPYLELDHLPESCVKCFLFAGHRDGWCKAKPLLHVYTHNKDRHPDCPIREDKATENVAIPAEEVSDDVLEPANRRGRKSTRD